MANKFKPTFLLWILAFFCLSASMTCSSKHTTEESPMTGLIKKIKTKKILIHGSDPAALNNEGLQSRFFLVRHAEKESKQRDPDLSEEGHERADRLATILDNIPLRRIYATNYRRTQLTAAPVATKMHVPVINYLPKKFKELFDQILEQPGNGHYLFVGHSDTVPLMLNHLTGKEVYQKIPAQTYDKLYVVSVYENKEVEVLELKY